MIVEYFSYAKIALASTISKKREIYDVQYYRADHRLFYRVILILNELCVTKFHVYIFKSLNNYFTKFGQLIVRKIITVIATRCQIFG